MLTFAVQKVKPKSILFDKLAEWPQTSADVFSDGAWAGHSVAVLGSQHKVMQGEPRGA